MAKRRKNLFQMSSTLSDVKECTNFTDAFEAYLDSIEWTYGDYARKAGCSLKHVWTSVHGKATMTFHFLKQLEQISNIEGSFWVKLYCDTFWDQIE